MSTTLIKQLREARMMWLDLPAEGKRVRVIRPTEVDMVKHFVIGGQIIIGIEQVSAYVVDWQGFTAADIVGAGLGASDPLAFDVALWGEVVSDKIEWLSTVAQGLVKLITDHQTAKAQDTKN